MSTGQPGFKLALIESLRLSPKEDACPDGHAECQCGGCQEIWFGCEMEAFGCNSSGMRDYDEEEDGAGGEEVGAHRCREYGMGKGKWGRLKLRHPHPTLSQWESEVNHSSSAQAETSPSASTSTRITFARQHTGQSSTYSWRSPCDRSIGMTISSPHAPQT